MSYLKKLSAALILLSLAAPFANGQLPFRIDIDPGTETTTVQPNMYGVFFEDINFGADGGLYAELVINRSFDFPHPFTGWMPFGDVKILNENSPFERNPNYVRLTHREDELTGTGLDNAGYRGIGLRKDGQYRYSFWARTGGGDMKVQIELVRSDDENPDRSEVTVSGSQWKKYSGVITSGFTDKHSRLRFKVLTPGTVDVDHISLFPVDTWNGHENGLRRDLVQALADLKPGVFRFPGGCIVEGNSLETRYQWKNTIGPVENRPLNDNRWNYTFDHKRFPEYYQSYGLGFYEYFLLCEELGADALPILSCGLSCQYESDEVVPLSELQPYIDDALDLIEFANGDPRTSRWAAIRAEMGHPAPFNLKMIGIGNEQWGEVYPERLEAFMEQIRTQYPEILIIGSSGPSADGEDFDYLWPEMRRLGVDLVDEHYYKEPGWFLANAGRYDDYDRNGPKVFAGEYAAHDYTHGKANNFYSALAEAAFMTGLERNADVVHLATYAPLFAHVDAWQWNPDLIWFDNLEVLLTPNYYVQQMYALYSGTDVVEISSPDGDLKGHKGVYATAALDKNEGYLIIKLVNTESRQVNFDINLKSGGYTFAGAAQVEVISTQNLYSGNSFEEPQYIAPHRSELQGIDDKITYQAPGWSFSVITLRYL